MLANDPRALIAAGVNRKSLEAILPTLPMPCLIYYGDADPGHARGQATAAQIPNGQFVSLPGADHWAGIYRSDLALPHIQAFLARVTREPEPVA